MCPFCLSFQIGGHEILLSISWQSIWGRCSVCGRCLLSPQAPPVCVSSFLGSLGLFRFKALTSDISVLKAKEPHFWSMLPWFSTNVHLRVNLFELGRAETQRKAAVLARSIGKRWAQPRSAPCPPAVHSSSLLSYLNSEPRFSD